MKTAIETERLLMRELLPTDAAGMFALDSDPEVHRYLGNNPLTDIAQSREMIANIRKQYTDNGIGRWAVVLKETNEFIGWSGLKLERNMNGREQFYDLGYRFIQKHWGKGYATESAKAFLDFGFNEMKLETICICADVGNAGSRNVIEKLGFRFVNLFKYKEEDAAWYEMTKAEYLRAHWGT